MTRIHLVRHGEPAFDRSRTVPRKGLRSALNEYAGSSLGNSDPPQALLGLLATAERCVVVSSELVRARCSAERLEPGEALSSPLLDEAPLPHPDRLPIPLPWSVVLVLCRGGWLLGYSRNAPGIRADRARAERAADWLEALAGKHTDVFALGHGIMHRLITKSLGERGWVEERASGSGYWACRTMRGPIAGAMDRAASGVNPDGGSRSLP